MVVALVLQIMPELLDLCGESTPPLSVEQLKVDPLEISVVAIPPLPPLEPNQMLDFEEKGHSYVAMSCSSESIGHVVPVGDVVVAPKAMARVPGALIAKEICDFLATLDAANPGSGKTVGCPLKEKAMRDKSKRVCGSHRSGIPKEKSLHSEDVCGRLMDDSLLFRLSCQMSFYRWACLAMLCSMGRGVVLVAGWGHLFVYWGDCEDSCFGCSP